jgi:hypothetical protein
MQSLAARNPTQARLRRRRLEGPAVEQLELRIHHQSPLIGIAMIGEKTLVIQ